MMYQIKRKSKAMFLAYLSICMILALFGNIAPEVNTTITGENWIEQITTVPSNIKIWKAEVDSDGVVYIATNVTIYKSVDLGQTWSDIYERAIDDIYVTNDKTICIFDGYYDKLRYSDDKGVTWHNATGWVGAETNDTPANWDEDSQGNLYMVNYELSPDGDTNDYVYKSVDGGKTYSVFYNVSASSNPVRHIHRVGVDSSGYPWITTGDAEWQYGEPDDNTIRKYNGTGWEYVVDGWTEKFLPIWFSQGYAYFGADTCDYSYRMPINGSWADRQRIWASNYFPSDAMDEAKVVENIHILGTLKSADGYGAIVASWDGLHWVKLFGGTKRTRISLRNHFPVYFVQYGTNKLYRINRICKEDLVQLFYSEYRINRGTLQNSENYILEQRIYNGTNYIDLTNVGIKDVSASIKGLSHYNNNLTNSGFETGDFSNWTTSGDGEKSVVSDEKYQGTYSAKFVKLSTETNPALIYQNLGTIKRGDVIIVSWACKSNGTMNKTANFRTCPLTLGIRNVTGATTKSFYYPCNTTWKIQHYAYVSETNTPWDLRIYFYFGNLNLTTWLDATVTRIPRVDYQTWQQSFDEESVTYHPMGINYSYSLGVLNTTNPSLLINGQTVFHSGELTEGTESATTTLSGILTGSVKLEANIQGSEQATLKLNGTRLLYEDSIILKAIKDSVYYGRYHGTFSPNTTTVDLIAVTSLASNITSLSYDGTKLTLTINSPSGQTSTTKVYVGDRGEPTNVSAINGTLTWSYNASTKILTLNVLHAAQTNILVEWRITGQWYMIQMRTRTGYSSYMSVPLPNSLYNTVKAWKDAGFSAVVVSDYLLKDERTHYTSNPNFDPRSGWYNYSVTGTPHASVANFSTSYPSNGGGPGSGRLYVNGTGKVMVSYYHSTYTAQSGRHTLDLYRTQFLEQWFGLATSFSGNVALGVEIRFSSGRSYIVYRRAGTGDYTNTTNTKYFKTLIDWSNRQPFTHTGVWLGYHEDAATIYDNPQFNITETYINLWGLTNYLNDKLHDFLWFVESFDTSSWVDAYFDNVHWTANRSWASYMKDIQFAESNHGIIVIPGYDITTGLPHGYENEGEAVDVNGVINYNGTVPSFLTTPVQVANRGGLAFLDELFFRPDGTRYPEEGNANLTDWLERGFIGCYIAYNLVKCWDPALKIIFDEKSTERMWMVQGEAIHGNHTQRALRSRYSMVYVEGPLTKQKIVDAISAGRIQAVYTMPRNERIRTNLTINDFSIGSWIMGDWAIPSSSPVLNIGVRCDVPIKNVTLHWNGKILKSWAPFTTTFRQSLNLSMSGVFRLVARDYGGNYMAIGNPIFLKPAIPYVKETTHPRDLTATFFGDKLTFTVSASIGATSITQVYSGDWGEPTAVSATNGSVTWGYDVSTKTLTLNVTHAGPTQIVVNWRIPGDVTGDKKVDVLDLFALGKAYESTPDSPNWNLDCDFNEDGAVNIHDLSILRKNYGKTKRW